MLGWLNKTACRLPGTSPNENTRKRESIFASWLYQAWWKVQWRNIITNGNTTVYILLGWKPCACMKMRIKNVPINFTLTYLLFFVVGSKVLRYIWLLLLRFPSTRIYFYFFVVTIFFVFRNNIFDIYSYLAQKLWKHCALKIIQLHKIYATQVLQFGRK